MAIQLNVTQVGGKLRVTVYNPGDYIAIIDNVGLAIEFGGGSLWYTARLAEDFYFGTGRIPRLWGGFLFDVNTPANAATAGATARYFEVDRSVQSSTINIS